MLLCAWVLVKSVSSPFLRPQENDLDSDSDCVTPIYFGSTHGSEVTLPWWKQGAPALGHGLLSKNYVPQATKTIRM
jgi:hypothetical protein